MQGTAQSLDEMLNTGLKHDVGNADIRENEIHGFLQIINSGLDALAPSFGTAREFTDEQREVCKLGLEVCNLVLERLNFLNISHSVSPNVNSTA